jgi:DNA-binding NtrC family response regulator
MKERFEGLVEHLIVSGFSMEEAVGLLEKMLIERGLAWSRGNQSAAAKRLGIHRNTLQRKMVEHGLARKPVSRAVAQARKRRAG